MKYFAKYLPVEGEIKEEDWVKSNHRNPDFPEEIFQMIGDNWNTYLKFKNITTDVFKKVKLFLCSRDIQVGDKVYGDYPTDDGSMILESDIEVKLSKYGTPIPYKVIGEISPEAIWVKEGDEFYEDEIKILKFSEKRRAFTYYTLPEVRVKIKCSQCNTFH